YRAGFLRACSGRRAATWILPCKCQQPLASTYVRSQSLSTDVGQRALTAICWYAVMDTTRAAAPAASAAGPVLGTGGPRSEGTRRAILGAARATFAERGYERATIRAVAARAGVDASMVMRYFQSKAGLFTA